MFGAFGDIDVEIAIPIVIAKGEAVPVSTVGVGPLDTAGCADVRERSAAIIYINKRPAGCHQAVAGHDQIEKAVVIDVAPDWVAHRLFCFGDQTYSCRNIAELLGHCNR